MWKSWFSLGKLLRLPIYFKGNRNAINVERYFVDQIMKRKIENRDKLLYDFPPCDGEYLVR